MNDSFFVLAGDGLRYGEHPSHKIAADGITLKTCAGWLRKRRYHFDEIVSVERVDRNATRSLGGTVFWAVVGGVLAGPMGAVAAGSYLGRSKTSVLSIEFNDGFRFLGRFTCEQFRKMSLAQRERGHVRKFLTEEARRIAG